jgi:hypothetical protein
MKLAKTLTMLTIRSLCRIAFVLLIASIGGMLPAQAQDVPDKMVATVSGGTRPELITYSDLVWQLALQPDTPSATPGSDRLNGALQLVINQRLILQEAERLPGMTPTDKEIQDELTRLVSLFPSQAEFQDRMKRVGLTSDQIREIIRQRVEINKYLDFRFRSFTVVTPAEVDDYYNQVYVPRFRRQQPGRIVPTLEQVRAEIERTLMESKIQSSTDQFLESARERAQITILNPV